MVRSISLIFDRIRWEEKELSRAVAGRGIGVKQIDAKGLVLKSDASERQVRREFGDISLQRCVSYFRGLHLAQYLEAKGCLVVNTSEVSRMCGNKFLTTLALERNATPTPRTAFTFSGDAAKVATDTIGYPSVLKPVVGSWGRGVARLNDRDSAYALIEMREESNGLLSQVYYIQRHIERPPRDIRTVVIGGELVSANYRYAPRGDWRTNVAIGGRIERCKVTKELEQIVLKAAEAVGGGVLGVDAMEGSDGLTVHEVNSTVEFKGAAQVSKIDIAEKIVDHIIKTGKR